MLRDIGNLLLATSLYGYTSESRIGTLVKPERINIHVEPYKAGEKFKEFWRKYHKNIIYFYVDSCPATVNLLKTIRELLEVYCVGTRLDEEINIKFDAFGLGEVHFPRIKASYVDYWDTVTCYNWIFERPLDDKALTVLRLWSPHFQRALQNYINRNLLDNNWGEIVFTWRFMISEDRRWYKVCVDIVGTPFFKYADAVEVAKAYARPKPVGRWK
ncbi:hypothetical protein DRP04_06770 [Archaeoglobales archaeon]|nr:MAG: hypothetical protein DRP04_06770 [Archaeoglobales archaeon]